MIFKTGSELFFSEPVMMFNGISGGDGMLSTALGNIKKRGVHLNQTAACRLHNNSFRIR